MLKKQKIIAFLAVIAIIASAVFIIERVSGVGLGANINMNNFKITNLGDPSGSQDAVNFRSLNTALQSGGAINYIPKWDGSLSFVSSILSNAGAEVSVAGTLNMNKNQIKQMAIENRTTNPAGPAVGQIWICTDAGNDCQ